MGGQQLGYATGAAVDMTTVIVTVDACQLNAELGARYSLSLRPVPEVPAGRHPVSVELWRVRDGRPEANGLDQHEWAERAGALMGGAMGAQTGGAVGTSVGALTGASMSGLAGAWLGPMGFLWGAAAGFMAGAAMGGTAVAAAGSAYGASLGRANARRLSALTSRALGTYHEVAILIPNVVRGSGEGESHLFVSGMHTDSAIAKFTAEAAGYGFGKRLARASCEPFRHWTVSSPDGGRLFEATLTCASEWTTAAENRDLEVLREWLSQPLLGHVGGGRFSVSRLDRLYDYENVLVSRAAGALSIGHGFDEALEPGHYDLLETGPEFFGAVHAQGVPVKVTHPEPFFH